MRPLKVQLADESVQKPLYSEKIPGPELAGWQEARCHTSWHHWRLSLLLRSALCLLKRSSSRFGLHSQFQRTKSHNMMKTMWITHPVDILVYFKTVFAWILLCAQILPSILTQVLKSDSRTSVATKAANYSPRTVFTQKLERLMSQSNNMVWHWFPPGNSVALL